MTSHPIIIYRQGGGRGGRGFLLLNLPSPPLGLCRILTILSSLAVNRLIPLLSP